MINHSEVIALSEKLTALLREHEQATIYWSCTYHVVELEGRKAYFMLYEIPSEKLVYEGFAPKIRTWLERRKIENEKVYNYQIIS